MKRKSDSYKIEGGGGEGGEQYPQDRRMSRGSSAGSRNKVAPMQLPTPTIVSAPTTPVSTPLTEIEYINEERRAVAWYTGDSEDTVSTTLPNGNDEPCPPVDSPEFPTQSSSLEDGMTTNITNKDRRTSSRGSIHPGGAATHVKDAFARKSSMLECPTDPLAAKDPMSLQEFNKTFNLLDDLPEDTTGGLPVTNKNADRDSLFFDDGKRRIDLIVVYQEEDFDLGVLTEEQTTRLRLRKEFLANLEQEGLELELVEKQSTFDERTYFMKVHVPWKVLTRYAEVMNLKMPIKRFYSISVKAWEGEEEKKPKTLETYTFPLAKLFELDSSRLAEEPSFYTATFNKDREEQFVIKDRETFFTSAQRSQIAWQILVRAKYDEDKKTGVRRLLNNGTFLSVFPLHEGNYDKDAADGLILDRRLLYLEWARPGRWYKKQPLWLVRKYFGDKIALYFAWLGFYTEMLIPPAIVGLLCFFYGISSMDSTDNIPSQEICDKSGPGNITLCPQCDKVCRYQRLHESCVFSKITYLFDNPATVFFAIFMSFWATTFLELWKRRQAVIAWEWDLQYAEDEEEPRPEFESTVKTFRINPVTRVKEPYMPLTKKAWHYTITVSTVLFMICVVMSAVLGTIIYRLSVVTYIYNGGNQFIRRHAKIFTSITGATLNLIIIMILTRFYHSIAIKLTNQENPRTQNEYEDSYTFKIFVFEFINYYSSLIYIAFFKGRFFSYPGDSDTRKTEFLKIKGDICDPAGCLFELCIQLAIIMVGKQLFNNFLELAYPAMINWWRMRTHKSRTKDPKRIYTRWEQDYQLQDPGRLALFEEYLEMVLQYGFVTLFVAAFPLAPLFALLNNIGEIRLDAFKMLAQSRRPIAERVEGIGAWYGILQGVTYCAVVSNAFVIAYTSDYIPRMVYKMVYSPTQDLVGYIDSSLSVFNTSDYSEEWGVNKDLDNDGSPDPDMCQYRGYRNGPDHSSDPYGLSPQYWHVFAARLAFVVIFEHLVFALTGIMAYTIPDVPSEIRTQIQRERMLQKEAEYEHGFNGKDEEDEYDRLLTALRENHNPSRLSDAIRRGSLCRRLSRQSDNNSESGGGGGGVGGGNDQSHHVQHVASRAKINTSTVWEVP